MEFTAKQIADILNGQIEGDANIKVSKLSKIEEGEPGSISFLANPLYTSYIYTTKASLVILNKDFQLTAPVSATLLRVNSAENAFAKLLEMYSQLKLNKSGISKLAFISESAKVGTNVYAGEFSFIGENAKIGNNVKIYPQVYVGDNVVVGDNTTLFSGVKLYSETLIGKDCIIHSGTVIGSDGFRFAPQNEVNKKIPQIGNVIIEDDVEIGANCAIDRATLGSTILRKGVKFDNLIHIAHNVEIGENTYMAADSVIAGSTKIGKNCMFSGQIGIVGHIQIADNTMLAAQSGI
jgi:UDP-3-O-[3-hydroxymyristoyl] glucosamine N-acyltransferase